MHRLVIAGAVALAVASYGRLGTAEEAEPVASTPTPELARFTLGAYASLGMAHSFYSRSEGPSPRFAGGGGAYVDFRPAKAFAFDVGIDLIGKGSLTKEGMYRLRFLYLEIPLGVKFFGGRLALGIALGIDVGLYNNKKPLEKLGIAHKEETNNWDAYKRFNLSPRVTLGYAIPVGPIAIVPGVAWSIEALSSLAEDEYHDWTLHNMNLMITLGVELGLGPSKAPDGATAPLEEEERFDRFALGAYVSLGASWPTVKNAGDSYYAQMYEEGPFPRFEGGGSIYFDFYLAKTFALDVGVGLVGKGYRGLSEYRMSLLCLRIPAGVKLSFYGVRIGLALALDVALSGKSYIYTGESTDTTTWGDEQWQSYRRTNFGPLLSLGYAIHVKRIAIVPGVSWSMELLDNAISEDDGRFERRIMSLMFDVGLEFGFGG